MFDWTAKITRLLELPGLTDEERDVLEEHLLWHSPELSGNSRLTPYPFPERVLERPIQGVLEELMEARGMSWSVRFKSQTALVEFQGPKDSFGASLGPVGLSLWVDGHGTTPAQALCDAILAALEVAPHD